MKTRAIVLVSVCVGGCKGGGGYGKLKQDRKITFQHLGIKWHINVLIVSLKWLVNVQCSRPAHTTRTHCKLTVNAWRSKLW